MTLSHDINHGRATSKTGFYTQVPCRWGCSPPPGEWGASSTPMLFCYFLPCRGGLDAVPSQVLVLPGCRAAGPHRPQPEWAAVDNSQRVRAARPTSHQTLEHSAAGGATVSPARHRLSRECPRHRDELPKSTFPLAAAPASRSGFPGRLPGLSRWCNKPPSAASRARVRTAPQRA